MDLDKLLSEAPETLLARAADEPRTGTLDLRRAKELSISRDTYLEAEARGMTLSELLESAEYDPSPIDSPLDAFERQLAARGLRVGGSAPVMRK